MITLEIINPIPGKGMGREYKSYDWDSFNGVNIPDSERPAGFVFPDDSNSILIGLLVKDESGDYLRNKIVEMISIDSTQNKTATGTGDITTIYIDGNKRVVPYYGYNYEFKTAGEHTITFKCEGVETSVTLTAK
jgi:hypothetical protein